MALAEPPDAPAQYQNVVHVPVTPNFELQVLGKTSIYTLHFPHNNEQSFLEHFAEFYL